LTGIALGHPGATPLLSTVNLARDLDDPCDVFARALNWWRTLGHVPDLLVIEAPVPPSKAWGETNFKTTHISLGLNAIFTGLATQQKIPVLSAPIAAWRKFFLGRGNMKGADAKLACVRLCRTLHWLAPDHNAAEAAGIWLWGCSQVAPKNVQRVEPLFTHGGPA
jgi:hypothetical protein